MSSVAGSASRDLSGRPERSSALEMLHAIVAASFVFLYLVLLRLMTLCLAPGLLFVRFAGLSPTIRRFRYLSLMIGESAVVGLGSAIDTRWSDWPVLLGVIPALLGSLALVQVSAAAIVRPPKSLDDVKPENALERWFAKRLRKPVDVYFVRVVWQNTLVALPAYAALVSPVSFGIWTMTMYVVALLTCASTQQNLVHTDCHNHMFRWRHLSHRVDRLIFRTFDLYAKYALMIMVSRVPLHYGVEHLTIHHVENNGVHDVQTTLFYDRTSFLDFCKAALREGVSGTIAIPIYRYLNERKMWRPRRRLTKGLEIWLGSLGLVAIICAPAAAFMFCVRFLAGVPTAASMFMWHGFVDLDRIDNCFAITTNIVPLETLGVQFMHADHHAHPNQHWTRQYENLSTEGEVYGREGTINLRPMANLNFMVVKALWRKRYDVLARWYIPIGGGFEDRNELAKVLQQRTRPLVERERGPFYRAVDDWLGWIAAEYLTPGRLPK
ncbi:hypothetical protein [Bradyrhizobium sp. SZCCHNRI3042]|uniref:hypothetical protein n=1 Tax=Bradyrhizobium sp. SZCCHNRI3042 TaxID=3057291 RepID=UPI00291674BF|nr:hypothetical protein [Bradyrhizobium sp. SZCCHNRI3042]